MKRYNIQLRDQITYVNRERYQTLREAVNALLHSDKVDLPRSPDEAYEFDEAPSGVPDEFTDTNYDRMEAAAFASKSPNREASKATQQVTPPEPDPAPVSEPPAPDQ